jgi:hypothetical protein
VNWRNVHTTVPASGEHENGSNFAITIGTLGFLECFRDFRAIYRLLQVFYFSYSADSCVLVVMADCLIILFGVNSFRDH